ncbi:MAG: antibiotic biosynthesis monooxygenase [Candidatus Competibacteraceae bacterium]|nr:antibiotic biosynthesis monooxygenase [Candidatus Competibacteraceae bacterium]MCP5134410.1 antibiotic biosynthesis monooxygenase [Gammaproteobacteria bacterium]
MVEVVSHHPVQKVVRITAKAGQEQELRDALKILEADTREEPGCVEFAFFQAISDEASFVLLEHFANEEAFMIHIQLPHTQAFFKAQLVAVVHAVDVPSLGDK